MLKSLATLALTTTVTSAHPAFWSQDPDACATHRDLICLFCTDPMSEDSLKGMSSYYATWCGRQFESMYLSGSLRDWCLEGLDLPPRN